MQGSTPTKTIMDSVAFSTPGLPIMHILHEIFSKPSIHIIC